MQKPSQKFINKGMSLLEVMITVALTGMLLFMGLTKFDDITKEQNVNGAVQQVAMAIKQARHYSRMNGVKTQITFTANRSTFAVTAGGSSIVNSNNFDAMSGDISGFGNAKIIGSSCSNIYFYIDGTPITSLSADSSSPMSSDCTVTIGYSDGVQKVVTVKALSGNVIYDK